ncbi:sterol desaturase family protein [Flavihumibacter fluvii]|uniref:sterol desaturase family protein n=1 Tax=Flavihumibacter fluvii TaxID=2838157 RepID=UPI001BDF70DE|nr:sterol desaturase family protein [Flavihumibacter fluvii]ULQ50712.1 sterol desaturase family protein [Flavihumibacter fluvii]
MFSKKALAKTLNTVENLFFLGFAITILWITVNSFFNGTWKSFRGMGFLEDITDPINKRIYYQVALTILSILTTFFLLFEMLKLFMQLNPFKEFSSKMPVLKLELVSLTLTNKISHLLSRMGNTQFVKEVFRRYKTNFLAKVFNDYISKLFIIFVYIEMMPYFRQFALFTIPNTWYGWLYAYLMWELTYWIWHFLGHRVRLFWCLHSPHHAPVEMNLTVAWVHFFAEGYYTAAIQVPLLMIFGVTPEMVAIILVIDGTWGTFIHAGEDAFKNGRLGILERILITPSHHRVHHARNPLYIDTNFCVLLPFWDWLFGTLQNERHEVKIEYGITRETIPTSFIDMYFGECICLFKDLKETPGFINKIKLLFQPPGWQPGSVEHTAKVVRQNFLKGREYLAKTSRDQLFSRTLIEPSLAPTKTGNP